MMKKTKKLYELSSADEALAKRLIEAQDKAAVTVIAAEAGITLTDADFEAIEAERKRIILTEGSEQLSDDELEAVAGGDACTCEDCGIGVSGKGMFTGDPKREAEDYTCRCSSFGQGNFMFYNVDGKPWRFRRCECTRYGNGESVLV